MGEIQIKEGIKIEAIQRAILLNLLVVCDRIGLLIKKKGII